VTYESIADVLAFLCCLGSFGTVGDMELTPINFHIIRIGKHRPLFLQGSVQIVWWTVRCDSGLCISKSSLAAPTLCQHI